MVDEPKPVIKLRIPKIFLMIQEQNRRDALKAKLIRRAKRNEEEHPFTIGYWTEEDFDE